MGDGQIRVIEVWVNSVLVDTETGKDDSNSGVGNTVVHTFTFTVPLTRFGADVSRIWPDGGTDS